MAAKSGRKNWTLQLTNLIGSEKTSEDELDEMGIFNSMTGPSTNNNETRFNQHAFLEKKAQTGISNTEGIRNGDRGVYVNAELSHHSSDQTRKNTSNNKTAIKFETEKKTHKHTTHRFSQEGFD
jgi:hypothetical protein